MFLVLLRRFWPIWWKGLLNGKGVSWLNFQNFLSHPVWWKATDFDFMDYSSPTPKKKTNNLRTIGIFRGYISYSFPGTMHLDGGFLLSTLKKISMSWSLIFSHFSHLKTSKNPHFFTTKKHTKRAIWFGWTKICEVITVTSSVSTWIWPIFWCQMEPQFKPPQRMGFFRLGFLLAVNTGSPRLSKE